MGLPINPCSLPAPNHLLFQLPWVMFQLSTFKPSSRPPLPLPLPACLPLGAVEPAHPGEMPALVDGLRLLHRADPLVQVTVQDTGEHVVAAAGQLLLAVPGSFCCSAACHHRASRLWRGRHGGRRRCCVAGLPASCLGLTGRPLRGAQRPATVRVRLCGPRGEHGAAHRHRITHYCCLLVLRGNELKARALHTYYRLLLLQGRFTWRRASHTYYRLLLLQGRSTWRRASRTCASALHG